MAFNIVELLEFVIVIFGVSTFFMDALLAGYQLDQPGFSASNIITIDFLFDKTFNVRETSIWCLAFSVINVFLPNHTINIWIFGPSREDENKTSYSDFEKKNRDFLIVKDCFIPNFIIRRISHSQIQQLEIRNQTDKRTLLRKILGVEFFSRDSYFMKLLN